MALSAAMVISGLSSEQFTEELKVVFNCGEVLLQAPISSSPVYSSSVSLGGGVTTLSAEALLGRLDRYLDIISNLEHRFQAFQGTKEVKSNRSKAVKVIYENRNILDLEQHLTSNWLFQPAILENEVRHSFGNKSQYSRINGATIPRHFMIECKENDCGFNEPKYY